MKYTRTALYTLAAVAQAAPASQTASELDLTFVKRGDVSVPFFHPKTISASFDITPALAPVSDKDNLATGVDRLVKELQLSGAADLKVTHTSKDASGTLHIYANRVVNGAPVDNQNCAIHVKDGQVLYYSASFTGAKGLVASKVAETKPTISLDDAVKSASSLLGLKRDGVPEKMVYVQVPNGSLVYAYQFQVKNEDGTKWFQVAVDAASGKVVQVVDYTNAVSFEVVKLPKVNPTEGFETVTDPADKTASPQGWNSDGAKSYTDTQGNNVDSRISSTRASGGASLDFSTKWDASKEPTTEDNKRAAIINNFYVSNMVHDITYQYGFNEAAGNFQAKNFGKGGKEGDHVLINNHAAGTNNANFATPPDGQNPTMNMYLWDTASPQRDGSLDNSVPIHEYGHGISNRLTGGPAQADCLQDEESGGMGEGWSDTFAMYLSRLPTDNRDTAFVLGAYVASNPNGIRTHPYTSDMSINPLTLEDLNTRDGVHAKGTVWATVLNELYWNLVDKLGFSANWLDAKQVKGNVVAMQLVMGGLSVQPCNPTFLDARDAILAADKSFYSGAYKCEIWKAFAKRGMGTDAVSQGWKNGFKVPAECDKDAPVTTISPEPSVTVTVSAPTTAVVGPTTAVAKPTTLVVEPTTAVAESTTAVVEPTTVVVETTTDIAETNTAEPTITSIASPVTTSGPVPTSAPPTGTCAHDKCKVGSPLEASCDECVAEIIAADEFCGRVEWDAACVVQVNSRCGIKCPW